MNNNHFSKRLVVLLATMGCLHVHAGQQTITNPIAPSGADPWIVKKGGMYVYCYSADDNSCIYVNTNNTIQAAAQFEGIPIWTPDPDTYYSRELWAPELHFLQGKWWLYVAADDGNNHNHRMVVLESKSDDPFGPYTFHGKIADSTDKWAIDGTPLEHQGNLYYIWSGWEGDENVQQNLYIAKMTNPKTISGHRVKICEPEYDWERIGQPYVNEGPQVLQNNGNTFVIYSASGSWTDHYCFG